ncbi:protein lava lamp [Aedes albopictus]|uniref:RPGRIP1 C-terminal domain-containing protein n=1 Tax=Aedes albopictus TaxID=7160 RepID=A0ABM2A5E7_AEDAL
MGRDEDQQHNMKKRPASASPYAENYRVPMDICQRHLINHRLMVSKLSRRELEDKYISLCDENFSMKKRYQEQEEQIKKLKVKLMRFSSLESNKTNKSDMKSNQSSKLHDLEEQRQELHEKLKALRNNQKKKESRKKRDAGKGSAQRRKGVESSTTRSSSSTNHRDDEDGYDEDRDEVSSTTDEDVEHGGPSTSARIQPKTVKSCHSCESLKAEKVANESEFVKMKMDIKFLHKEIQNEKEKSALLGRQLEEKLSYEIMKRNAAENVEVINLTRQVDDMAKQIQRQQDEQRRALEAELTKQADLEVHIRREKDKNSALFEECERLKKNIERIKENMSEVEIERDFLKRQQENFTKVVDENKLLRYQLEELRKQNEELARQIETLREEEAVTKGAHKDLLEKLKTLQQDNDTLSILLEGLRSENETLAEEKTVLQQNLKSLEASPEKDKPSSPVVGIDGATQTDITEIIIDKRSTTAVQTESHEEQIYQASSKWSSSSEPEDRHSEEVVSRTPKTMRLSEDSVMRHHRTSPKQVRISQILPRITLLQQNTLQDSAKSKPSNAALLLSNTYAQSVERELMNTSFTRRGQGHTVVSVSPVSSNSMDKKRISFQEEERSITSEETSSQTKGDDQGSTSLLEKNQAEEIQQNYASYFGLTPEVQQRTREYSLILDRTSTSLSSSASQDDYIALTIEKVCWKDSTLSKLLERKVQHFYVEFGFLGERGHRLETPQSADLLAGNGACQQDGRPSLEHIFEHRVGFRLGGPKYESRRQLLREMLLPGGRDMVRFLIVHEQVEVRNCSEIGFASFRLKQEIQDAKVEDSKLIEAAIYDIKDPVNEMGVLYVLLEGIHLLRAKFWS